VLQFPNASESFKRENPHIFAEGTLGQILLEPKEPEPTKAEIKSEKQLQEQIVGFLERNNVVVIRSRMDRKTSTNVGTPDLLFSVRMRAIAFEVKLPGKKPAEEQRNMMLRMTGNGWACFIIHSYDEAVEVYHSLLESK
jgi:hypothetical protein